MLFSTCSVLSRTITETELNLYFLVFGAGVGTIPWLLLGELCPSKVKGIASGVTVSVAFVMIFAVVKIFPYGLEYLSPAGTYGFFAGVRTILQFILTWPGLQLSYQLSCWLPVFHIFSLSPYHTCFKSSTLYIVV